MKKTNKLTIKLIIAIGLLVILGLGMILLDINNSTSVNAEAAYYSAEQYTGDDKLLMPNGKLSGKSIHDFAYDVKNAPLGQAFSELSQVIPLEYLESLETSAEFSYNGKEYGFYLAKEGDNFDLLLIDFIYEFDDSGHSDLEYKIRIKPILQQRFYREQEANGYRWLKAVSWDRYYIANPRFLTLVRNENALNYGEVGYSKMKDDGVIIIQTRANYGKIDYKTGEDLFETCASFVGKKVLSSISDIWDMLYPPETAIAPRGIGTAYGIFKVVKELLSFAKNLYEGGQEYTILADNENNIFTQQSKSAQRRGPQDGYSRTAAFVPDSEIILSDVDNSYAEFITVLNEANYRTRLNQYCEFDIVKRSGSYGSMEQVNDADNGELYSFSKERVLFSGDSEKPVEIDSSASVYTLPNGTDAFIFNPQYASDYEIRFELNSEAEISVNGVKRRGKNITLKQYADNINHMTIDISGDTVGIRGAVTVSPNSGGTLDRVPTGKNYILKRNLSGIRKLKTNHPDLEIQDFYKMGNGGLSRYTEYGTITPAEEISYPFPNDTYYVIIHNKSSNILTAQRFTDEDISSLKIGAQNNVDLQPSNWNFFKITANTTANHIITFPEISDGAMSSMLLYPNLSTGGVSSYGTQVYVVGLEANQTFYFGIKPEREEYQTPVLINQTENSFQWKISGGEFGSDGQIVSQDNVSVKRGKTYTLSFLINGRDSGAALSLQDATTHFGLYDFSINSANQVTVPSNCPIGGNGVTVNAWASVEQNTFYEHTLNLIPTDILRPTNHRIENSDLLEVHFMVPRFVKQVEFKLSSDDFEQSGTVEIDEHNINNKNGNWISIDLVHELGQTDAIIIAFDITKIVYLDALGNELVNSTDYFINTFNKLFAYGDGTVKNPYEITCMRHFNNMKKCLSSAFILEMDLKLDNWDAIPEFSGDLDLNGCTIQYKAENVEYNQNYGFITENYGTIRNGVFVPYIRGGNGTGGTNSELITIGGVVAKNYGTIENIEVQSTIGTSADYYNSNGHNTDISVASTYYSIGGIAGHNYSNVVNCRNYASMGGDNFIGGIVGVNFENAVIRGCSNYGDIYYDARFARSMQSGGIVSTVRDGGQLTGVKNYGNITFASCSVSNIASYSGAAVIGLANIGGSVCETATITDYVCNGRVIIDWEVRNKLTSKQLETIKTNGDPVGKYFAKPGSGSSGGGCVATGTLITLADGSQVPVEQLTGNEMLLVWNMMTGDFDAAPILFIDNDPLQEYEIINLSFSDGTAVKVIYEHGFWDYTLNEYVFIREDAAQYIGHWFNKQTLNADGEMVSSRVRLIDVTVTTEYTQAWSPVTYGHLCYYVNGMLSMPGATEGFVNVFEVNPDTLAYDAEAFEADIAKYGLFSYEEFSELLAIPEEVFDAFNGQYLKVSLGKGLITMEQLQTLAERYAPFFAGNDSKTL